MKYTTYLFDWDGTLVNSMPIWYGVFQDTFKDFTPGLSIDQERLCYNNWENIRGFVEMSDEKWEELMVFAGKISRERLQKIDLVPGALKALKVIHKEGHKTALLTRSFKDIVGDMLEHHGLIGAFDSVITFDDVENHKPHPAPLLMAMEELGAEPSETVMVGDSDTDLMAANNAKIDSMLFFPKAHAKIYSKKQLQSFKPKHTFESWDEFLKLIQ